MKDDNLKTTKVAKFLTGFLWTVCFIYLIVFGVTGGFYGIESIEIVFMYSVLFHTVFFPFVIYGLGGLIIMLMPDHEYLSVYSKVWRMFGFCALICLGIIGLSECAHYFGLISLRF